MYKFCFNNVKQEYELTEMVRMFLPKSEFAVLDSKDPIAESEQQDEDIVVRIPDSIVSRDEGKRYIYDRLKEITGETLEWGTLTGVRPVKLAGELLAKVHSEKRTKEILESYYYLNPQKAQLLLDTRRVQQPYLEELKEKSLSLYIGIPFCPSRCIYCSFPSNQTSYDEIRKYLFALEKEIRFAGAETSKKGFCPETVYIGGGTPTVLEDKELERLLGVIRKSFDLSKVREFTLEAGRPDTITKSKLVISKEKGVDRISINPQSMHRATLDKIGRNHSPETVLEAFELARKVGFNVINADLIAGLPEEEVEDFAESLRILTDLVPENITIHTLAVKRASGLKGVDENYSYRQGDKVKKMLALGQNSLNRLGYRSYYLYRQKQMAGNLENVGYAYPGKESIYNIRIMEENQTILALGAGGISKAYYPEENRLTRIPNVANYEIYIERIDEMIERKRTGLFKS